MSLKGTSGHLKDPQYQQKWRRALNATVRLLMKRAHEGGVLDQEIVAILEAELHLAEKVVQDALHYMERESLVSVVPVEGELVRGELYALSAAGVSAVATGSDPYITVRLTDG